MSWGLLTDFGAENRILSPHLHFVIRPLGPDRRAVDAEHLDRSHPHRSVFRAVPALHPDALCFIAVASTVRAAACFAAVVVFRRAFCHCNRIRRNSKVVESYVAVVRRGPICGASTMECGEVEFVQVDCVVVAQAECIYI